MKKLRILLFSVLLSFTIVAFNKNVKANEELPTPIHTITGDYDEVNDVYKSTLEISLGFEESTSGVLIQYQLFEGLPPSTWTVYSNPIPVQRRGNYRLNYRAFTPSGVYGSTQGFNIRVDIPILETYPNVIRNNQIIKHQDTGEPIILPEYSPREKEIRGV